MLDDYLMLNRRTLLKAGVSALPLASKGMELNSTAADPAAAPTGAASDVPWQRRIRRIGQLNMTEHDPVSMNVEEWADYFASLKVDVVPVSVTGIMAFYQTKVPFHRKGRFLGDRDFFGDCCNAAKKRGIRVIGRMSPDLNWEDAVRAHPEWFQRDKEDQPIPTPDDPRLFKTCMFSPYMTEYMTAIMKEVNSLYDVDGLFTNGWPPLGNLPTCYCRNCKNLPPPGTPAFWDKFNERTIYLWKLYDGIAKEKGSSNFFFANLGGGIHSGPNLVDLGNVCEWFQCDNQGRGGDDTPIWGCALQGRVCSAVQNGKMATNVTGAWSTGAVRWRNVSKSASEAQMWLSATVASGMVPYWHFIGAENGLGEDRRWHETGKKFFDWTAKHDRHFVNKRSIAKLGMVMGQRAHLFYNPPHGAPKRTYMAEAIDGMYYALLEGRFFFDFVHEDKLGAEELSQYTALVLPNTALLSDKQCQQLRAYVDAGGSLLATFETSMYTERNERRADFGLADVFGIHKAGEVKGTVGNAYYAWIEKQHPVLAGFTNTNWLPGAEHRLPVAPVDGPVLTVAPNFAAYPPELSYPSQLHTDEPALVLREKGKSRLAYFPGDIDHTLWRTGHTDLTRLLQNSIRWVLGGNQPVSVEGDGLIEAFAWETEAGFAVHVLNYTNPNAHRGWIRDFYPLAAQKVRMTVPRGRHIQRIELLRAGVDLPVRMTGNTVEFTIPKILDYEVAALYSA
jgi:Hypothetical glycosyl hydrolase 6/Beta-galactosidase trimerisation domain